MTHHWGYGTHLPNSWLTQRYFHGCVQSYFICNVYNTHSPRIIEVPGYCQELIDEYDRPMAIRWFIYRNVER